MFIIATSIFDGFDLGSTYLAMIGIGFFLAVGFFGKR